MMHWTQRKRRTRMAGVLAVLLVLTLALSACGGQEEDVTEPPIESPGAPDDGGGLDPGQSDGPDQKREAPEKGGESGAGEDATGDPSSSQ